MSSLSREWWDQLRSDRPFVFTLFFIRCFDACIRHWLRESNAAMLFWKLAFGGRILSFMGKNPRCVGTNLPLSLSDRVNCVTSSSLVRGVQIRVFYGNLSSQGFGKSYPAPPLLTLNHIMDFCTFFFLLKTKKEKGSQESLRNKV